MGNRRIISLNIDDKIYSEYSKQCKEEGIIMSRQVEKFMKEKLENEK